MLHIEEHGGNCCGIQHLFNFSGHAPAAKDEAVRLIKEGIDGCIAMYDTCDDPDCDCLSFKEAQAGWRCAIEVVLASYQMEDWADALKECGFTEVFSFHNSNSGNRCHVFFLETNKRD